jgi:hypothetical protein
VDSGEDELDFSGVAAGGRFEEVAYYYFSVQKR